MKRESFIFYKSFYDSIKDLGVEDQVQIYNAIFNYQFYGETTELKGVCKSIFMLIIPQLEANNKRYENGKKGGRPANQTITKTKPKNNQNKTKIKPNNNQTITKAEPNVNDNDNVNDNENVNVNDNDCFSYYEKQFCRTLSPLEYEKISTWQNWFDDDIIKLAIDMTILNGARSMNYTDKIINNWHDKGYTKIEQCKNEKKETKPSWYGKEFEEQKATDEEIQELEAKMERVLKK